MRNKQMEINTCKFLLLFKISRTHARKITLLSGFREFEPPIEKLPLFSAKMGTSMVYVSGWGLPTLQKDKEINNIK